MRCIARDNTIFTKYLARITGKIEDWAGINAYKGPNRQFSEGQQFGGRMGFNLGLGRGVEIRSVCQRFCLNDSLSCTVNPAEISR